MQENDVQPSAPTIYFRIVEYHDTFPSLYGLFITNTQNGEMCFAIDAATAPIQSHSRQLLRDYANAVGWTEEGAGAILAAS